MPPTEGIEPGRREAGSALDVSDGGIEPGLGEGEIEPAGSGAELGIAVGGIEEALGGVEPSFSGADDSGFLLGGIELGLRDEGATLGGLGVVVLCGEPSSTT